MKRKRPSTLRQELSELRDEVARLRAEVGASRRPGFPGPRVPAPQPWDMSPPIIGNCLACRYSGVCNCVRYDRVTTTYDPALAACAPLNTTFQIAPGTTRMWANPNTGAAPVPAVTIVPLTTGGARP